jgi:cytidine deaminase
MGGMNDKELLEAAKRVMQRAYAPYSKYKVGSAVLMADGTVYEGCNVENANFANGICAERAAFVQAVSAGKRDFKVVAVATKAPDAWPCGLCRQFISEFGTDIRIIVESPDGGISEMRIGELLPNRIEPAK